MSYDTVVLADSPNFYYKMGEASSPLVDSTANHPNISIGSSGGTPPTYGVTTPVGKGVEFTSANCWATGHGGGGGYAGQSTTGPFSHELILKVPVAATGTYCLVGWDDPVFIGNGWYLKVKAGLFGLIDHTSQTDFTAVGMNDGAYHYMVGTYDGTTWTGYMDGTALATTVTHTITTGGANMTVGGTQGSSNLFTTKDSVVIGNWAGYNSVLSQAQITAHYNAFLGIGPADPTLGIIQPIVHGRFG